MEEYLLRNLASLAERRAINVREEAMMWDMLARDLKREAKRREEKHKDRATKPKTSAPEQSDALKGRLYIRVSEAKKVMGMGRSSIYKEINAGRLPVKRIGRKTFIAVKDIHAWFDNLSEKQ